MYVVTSVVSVNSQGMNVVSSTESFKFRSDSNELITIICLEYVLWNYLINFAPVQKEGHGSPCAKGSNDLW